MAPRPDRPAGLSDGARPALVPYQEPDPAGDEPEKEPRENPWPTGVPGHQSLKGPAERIEHEASDDLPRGLHLRLGPGEPDQELGEGVGQEMPEPARHHEGH